MLEGVNLEDKETIVTVTTVIKAVLDGVKVKLAYQKELTNMKYATSQMICNNYCMLCFFGKR